MPSIQDVADQINAKLDSIVSSTAQNATISAEIRDEVQTLNSRVSTLDAHLQAGVATLAGGLFAILEVGRAQLDEARHHTAQNDTIICLLENANELLCGITRKLTTEIELTRTIKDSTKRLEGIAERVEPGAAGDYDRALAALKRLEECCPPPRKEPERCPERCEVPKPSPYHPKGQDWRPPEVREPIG